MTTWTLVRHGTRRTELRSYFSSMSFVQDITGNVQKVHSIARIPIESGPAAASRILNILYNTKAIARSDAVLTSYIFMLTPSCTNSA